MKICNKIFACSVIDVGSEWRTFSNDTKEDPSRVGGPENLLLSGSDLSTIIGPATGEASFNEFGLPKYRNRSMVKQISTYRTIVSHILVSIIRVLFQMSPSDQTLIKAFREIGNMADRIDLTKSIVDRANFLFKQVHESGRLKRRSIDLIASACLYTACRKESVPRTFKVGISFLLFFFFLRCIDTFSPDSKILL